MPGSATNHKTPEAPPGATARLSFELRAEVLRSARVPDEGSSVDNPKPQTLVYVQLGLMLLPSSLVFRA